MFFYSERKPAVHRGTGKVWWQNPGTPCHSALSAAGKHIMHKKRLWSAKHQGPSQVTHFSQQGCNPKGVCVGGVVYAGTHIWSAHGGQRTMSNVILGTFFNSSEERASHWSVAHQVG